MIINYLNTPVETVVEPPIKTNIQELPLEKLSWEDFEKLCLAIVQLTHEIQDCEIFGTKGQTQEGIDIYARQIDGSYFSYQCKRYKNLKTSDLQKIIDLFKEKEFFNKSKRLYLCTSCELNKVQLQRKFEKLKTELQQDNIELIKYDKIQLSRILKDHPRIVFDFFGSEWVKLYIGEHALKEIPISKKLDARDVIKYRKELYQFYSTIFNIQDPGIPVKEINATYPIQERFIVPDIISHIKGNIFGDEVENDVITEEPVIDFQQEQLYYEDNWYEEEIDHIRRKRKDYRITTENSNFGGRINIDDAFIHSDKNIIIGDPGTGKSTLLRYIVLDILSNSPTLTNISQKYGKLLPIWLPFAFITKHLSQDDSLSISQILKLWFNSAGNGSLYELADTALRDERLLLVIDGIDEWNNISAAQQAINRIETIRELFECQVIYSSRPYGFRLLKDFFTSPKVLNLAGFSNNQQYEFVEKWYTKWVSQQKKAITDPKLIKIHTGLFITELQKTGDLKKLAETPLLLSILIVQKLRDAILPKNKLEALREITQYLINKHPTKRSTDAGIVEESSTDIDFYEIFCELAIYIQKVSNDGVIRKDEACKTITKFLMEYANYDLVSARAKSRKLIEVGANSFGIIVEKSNDEISFGHKQFQEYLAAKYLQDSDEDLANEFIHEFAADPSFHQIIVNFFGLIPLKQIKRYYKHFSALQISSHEDYQRNYLKLIGYEIVLSLENAPAEIQNSSLKQIFHEFEFETDDLYKEALLKRILEGSTNNRMNERIIDFILRYLPNKIIYRDPRVQSFLKIDQLTEVQINFITRTFINNSLEGRYEASLVLKKHIDKPQIFEFVSNLIENCTNPEILAFAINALISDKVEGYEIDQLIGKIESEIPLVKFFLYKFKVFRKKQCEKDLEELIKLGSQLPYHIRNEAADVLIQGYGNGKKLKEISIYSVKKDRNLLNGEIAINNNVAWKILTHCYNKDKQVIDLIKIEFEQESHPFSSIDPIHMLDYIPIYFKDNKHIKIAVAKWLTKRIERFNSYDRKFALASVYIKTDEIKNSLLDNLTKSNFSYWNVMALVKGWPADLEVKEKLKTYFRTADRARISSSTGFVSEIFDAHEKEEAIQILESILFDTDLAFRERSISSLIQLDRQYFEQRILSRLLNQIGDFRKNVLDQYQTIIEKLAENFSSKQEVKSLVLESFSKDVYLSSIVAKYYPEYFNEDYQDLNSSLSLSKSLRFLMTEFFYESDRLPKKIEDTFCNFSLEEDEDIKSDMATCIFRHGKTALSEKILEIVQPLVFFRGYNYTGLRNIAFNGYLIAGQLEKYFCLEKMGNLARPFQFFDEYDFQRNNRGLIHQTLIEHFDHFIEHVGKDFQFLSNEKLSTDNIEYLWSFFAERSLRSSKSFPYIVDYINENSDTITDSRIISFLSRTLPKSPIFKKILLQILNNTTAKNKALAGTLLGTHFRDDNEVYEDIKSVKAHDDIGRIIALCTGWKNEPVLKEIWEKINVERNNFNDYVFFSLKFLFNDLVDLKKFLDYIFQNLKDSEHFHKYFYVALLERLRADGNFVLLIKEILLTTNNIHEKISFYNLISVTNNIDNEVLNWKKSTVDFKNDYGYDIISNKMVRLRDILHDYYF